MGVALKGAITPTAAFNIRPSHAAPMGRMRNLLLLALSLPACSPPPAPGPAPVTCPSDHAVAVRDAVYFGLTTPNGALIPEADWAAFLNATVTPAFPHGFTVLEANGQWRGADGGMVREPSRVLLLLHPASAELDERVRGIIRRYRQEFRQQAVLWERTITCMTLGT